SNHYLIRQAIWFAFGLLGFVFTSIFPYKKYQKLMKLIIILVIILLLGLFLFGSTVNNAKSWYNFGPASFQPAEFAKLALIMY
ncbi:cell division protein FtsW, partial [Bacilli bacterium]